MHAETKAAPYALEGTEVPADIGAKKTRNSGQGDGPYGQAEPYRRFLADEDYLTVFTAIATRALLWTLSVPPASP